MPGAPGPDETRRTRSAKTTRNRRPTDTERSMFVFLAVAGGATAQLVQVAGAVLVLAAFAGAQHGAFDVHGRSYLLLNVLGAGTLAVLAAADRQYGFLLLEGVWTLVSLASLARTPRRRPT
jgi:hypothetical protein